MSGPNVAQPDERTYRVSWWQVLRLVTLVFVASVGPQLLSVLRGKPNAGWPVIVAVAMTVAALMAVALRFILRVSVSGAGIRGASARVVKWEEVTDVEGARLLGGFVVRSMHAPTVTVAESIERNREFRRQILEVISSEHLIAKRLRGSAARQDQQR